MMFIKDFFLKIMTLPIHIFNPKILKNFHIQSHYDASYL